MVFPLYVVVAQSFGLQPCHSIYGKHMSENNQCPCGLEQVYSDCCGPYIEGAAIAATPEALMRSRYTAFSMDKVDYLKATWHPETLPEDLGEDEPSNWIGLEIIDWGMDDEEQDGEVEFKAKLIFDNKLELLHEVSQFDKIDGKWVYHSGEFKSDEAQVSKIPKSAPCPCGSGKKFKNCHYEA